MQGCLSEWYTVSCSVVHLVWYIVSCSVVYLVWYTVSCSVVHLVWQTVSCSVVHCILQCGTVVHCILQWGTLYSSYLLCQLNIFLILHQGARVRKYFYFILSHYKVVNRIWNLCPVPGGVWGTRLPPRCKSDLCDNWSR